MARLIVRDEHESIVFSEGSLPSSDSMLNRFPRHTGKAIPLHELPKSEDERRAWLLTLHAYEIADRRGYNCLHRPPLETWIIGRPRGPPAALAPWFEGMDSEYRLLIHRSPMPPHGSREWIDRAYESWTPVYVRLGIRRKRMPTGVFMAAAQNLLDRVHHAYRSDPTALAGLFEASGHAYARSAGPIQGYSRRLLSGFGSSRIHIHDQS